MNRAKLYLVVRSDLTPAQQAVQACHAMTEFLVEHKERASQWYSSSNTLVFLVVPDEQDLIRLASKADRKGVRFSSFREPDRENELTAVAFEPKARSLLSNLPLAFGV